MADDRCGARLCSRCPDKEREGILRRLRKSKNSQDRLAHEPKRLERILSEIRKRGFATRDPSFTGGDTTIFLAVATARLRIDGLLAIVGPATKCDLGRGGMHLEVRTKRAQ